MADLSKATPRPWRHDNINEQFSYVSTEQSLGGGDIATTWGAAGNADADAALIVRAVNERDELVAALLDMLQLFSKPYPEGYVDDGTSYKLAVDIVNRARAALAKAGAPTLARPEE